MGVHDWSKVPTDEWPSFHTSWLSELHKSLNRGLLPAGHESFLERSVGVTPDLMDVELYESTDGFGPTDGTPAEGGSVALAESPPAASRVSDFVTIAHREIAIREPKTGRLRALIELVSPGNKSSRQRLDAFIGKCQTALDRGVHLVVIDLLPDTSLCPDGLEPLIGSGDGAPRPRDAVAFFAGFRAGDLRDAEPHRSYVDYAAVCDDLPQTPLFISPERYVPLPLSATYEEAVLSLAASTRRMLSVR